MLIATQGFVLHTTPYAETSVVAKVFTRQMGLKSYIVKGVRTARGRVKQNLLQPLSDLDMVVYDNPRSTLNYVKELSPHGPQPTVSAVENALRFFMTEVLYRSLHEEEPLPQLFDYVEQVSQCPAHSPQSAAHLPIEFMLAVAGHLGIEPMDNHSHRTPYFCLEEGRYMPAPSETTLTPDLSLLLHNYLSSTAVASTLKDRQALLDALLTYFHIHFSGFASFHSHEVLHTILSTPQALSPGSLNTAAND